MHFVGIYCKNLPTFQSKANFISEMWESIWTRFRDRKSNLFKMTHLGKSHNFENFHVEKFRFPVPKSRSDCFPHLWNEFIFALWSREMFLDNYKIDFAWIQDVVKLKSEFLWNWWILTKIWTNRKILKIFILKRFDFLTQNLVQIVSQTSEIKFALLREVGRCL